MWAYRRSGTLDYDAVALVARADEMIELIGPCRLPAFSPVPNLVAHV
jgi:hypothetical protein